MKKLSLLMLVALAAASVAMAQAPGVGVTPGNPGNQPGVNTPPTYFGGDVLGAHNGYGRGCVMCHAPHGGAQGNGVYATTADQYNGVIALWGQNLAPYYNLSTAFSGDNTTKYAVTLPSNPLAGISDANTIILLCLSCHDGSIARVSMMQGQTVETLPVVGGHAPTLFGLVPGNTSTYYANDHPVGPNANVGCGGGHNWDCTGGGNSTQPIYMSGKASSQFLLNYAASFWNGESCTTSSTTTWGYTCSKNPLASFGGNTVNAVTCTTCHNQHSMTVWSVGGVNYTTMFFLKGYYNPYSGGNNVAQFCRNCHGGASNEMEGLMTIPTT